jgi:hypothetical protein
MSWLWSWFTGKEISKEEVPKDVSEEVPNDVPKDVPKEVSEDVKVLEGLNDEPEILELDARNVVEVPMPHSVVVYAQKMCSKCNLNLRRVHFHKKEWRKTPRVCKSCKGF